MPILHQIEAELGRMREERLLFRLRHDFAATRLRLCATHREASEARRQERAAREQFEYLDRSILAAETRLSFRIMPPAEGR